MRTLGEIRRDLDQVDDEIARLFRCRMKLVDEVADAKRANGQAVSDSKREQDILERIGRIAGEKDSPAAKALFTRMFELSKERQRCSIISS